MRKLIKGLSIFIFLLSTVYLVNTLNIGGHGGVTFSTWLWVCFCGGSGSFMIADMLCDLLDID